MAQHISLISKAFVDFAFATLIQSTVLIAVLLLAEVSLRKKVRPALRYWLVMLVYAHLVLSPVLAMPVGAGHWPGVNAARANPNDEAAGHRQALLPAGGKETLEGLSAEPQDGVAYITWQTIVFLFWVLAVCAMVSVLTWRAAVARKHISQAPQANLLMNDILVYCGRCLHVRERVRLRVSEAGTNPVVSGLLQPVILVPRDLAPTLGSRHLRAILFHELAHVRRHDLWTHWVQTVLQILYFYNPLLWLANATIRRLREQATDETVLDAVGEKDPSYVQLLAEVARLPYRPSEPSLRLIGLS